MNATTDIDLTAIMEREGIQKIEYFCGGMYSVRLKDKRAGVGDSVGKALKAAKQS